MFEQTRLHANEFENEYEGDRSCKQGHENCDRTPFSQLNNLKQLPVEAVLEN